MKTGNHIGEKFSPTLTTSQTTPKKHDYIHHPTFTHG